MRTKKELLELHEKASNDYAINIRRFRNQWIDNNRCECVDKMIEGNDLYCVHMKNYLRSFFKREETVLMDLICAIMLKDGVQTDLVKQFHKMGL